MTPYITHISYKLLVKPQIIFNQRIVYESMFLITLLSEYKFLQFLFHNPAFFVLVFSLSSPFHSLSPPWSFFRMTLSLCLLAELQVSLFSFGCTVLLLHQHLIQDQKHHSWRKLTPYMCFLCNVPHIHPCWVMVAFHHHAWEYLKRRNYLDL